MTAMDLPAYVPGYALERPLGTGEHGPVWAAREQGSGQLVAIKFLTTVSPEHHAFASREAAVLATIDHPHLVPFYGAVELDGGLGLVTALAEGGSLADLLGERGALSPGEVVTVCAPLAQALADAHERGLVHGDIKPANVLFTSDGRPMLADLGTVRMASAAGPGLVPQPGFTAPEVEAGYPPSAASDVYGIAAVAVAALTGYLPGQPPALPGIAPAAEGAISRALHPDPTRRIDAESLSDALFTIADPEPVALGPLSGEHDPVVDEAEVPEDGPEDGPGDAVGGGRRAGRSHRPEAPEPVRARRRSRRPRRRDVLVGLTIFLMVPVVAFGVYVVWNQFSGDGEGDELPEAGRVNDPTRAEERVDLCGGPQPAPTEQPPEVTDWTSVVESLYALRTEAFNELDAELLCQVYSPTSPFLASDYELLQTYGEAGVRTAGLRFELVDVELESEQGETPVVLEITDRIPPYQLVDGNGDVEVEWPGLGEATWQAQLVPSSDASGWRFG